MLEGKCFAPADILDLDVLEAARVYSWRRYIDDDDPSWLQANVSVSAVKVEMNNRHQQLVSRGETGFYCKGDELWNMVDSALQPFRGVSSVESAIAQLPDDTRGGALPGPNWLKPVLIGAGVLSVLGLGFWWMWRGAGPPRLRRYKVFRRRRRNSECPYGRPHYGGRPCSACTDG